MLSKNSQTGQALIVIAIAFIVIAGMLGLVIDGGVAQSQKQTSQAAADGAALAAAYTLQQEPSAANFSAAQVAADHIITIDGLATSSLTLTYLQADRSIATTPANAKYVHAVVTFSTPTFFLRVLNFNSFASASTAEVTLTSQEPSLTT